MGLGAFPSTNMLRYRASLYHFTPAQDADGGINPAACYPTAYATNVPCLAQRTGTETREGDDGRLTQYNTWSLVFGDDEGFKPRDLVQVYSGGTLIHTVEVVGQMNAGGRGVMWQIDAEEKV